MLFLGPLIVVLALILLYSDIGIIHLNKLQQERNELIASNKMLEEENRLLMEKIDRIKNDPQYIEDEARKRLGLVRPDEQIFHVNTEP